MRGHAGAQRGESPHWVNNGGLLGIAAAAGYGIRQLLRVDLPLGSMADRQGGLVTWAQAMAAGVHRSDVGYLGRRGAWERVRRGLYAEAGRSAAGHGFVAPPRP